MKSTVMKQTQHALSKQIITGNILVVHPLFAKYQNNIGIILISSLQKLVYLENLYINLEEPPLSPNNYSATVYLIMDKIRMVLVDGPLLQSLVESYPSLQLFPHIAFATLRFKILVVLLIQRNSDKYQKSAIKNTKTYGLKQSLISPTSLIYSHKNIMKYYWEQIPVNPISFITMEFQKSFNVQKSLISSMSFMDYTKQGFIAYTSSSPPNTSLPSQTEVVLLPLMK